jgi:UDP-N-acetylglucosamine acyltransferase
VHGPGRLILIDPRAVIDPAAELEEGVSVGPFAVIGARVQIGRGTWIGPHAVLKGPTRIGADNKIYQFASVGEDPQDKKYGGEPTHLQIGDRNVIRECATVHRGTAQDKGLTCVGDDNLLMAYTHVAHDCVIGNHAILANAASLGGHVDIDDWAILGGFTIVHQFCRIGGHSFCAMGSVISKDVPAYVMVGGHPAEPHGINAEGLRRRQFGEQAIQQIRRAYKVLYKSGLSLAEAIGELRSLARQSPELDLLLASLERSERSITR